MENQAECPLIASVRQHCCRPQTDCHNLCADDMWMDDDMEAGTDEDTGERYTCWDVQMAMEIHPEMCELIRDHHQDCCKYDSPDSPDSPDDEDRPKWNKQMAKKKAAKKKAKKKILKKRGMEDMKKSDVWMSNEHV